MLHVARFLHAFTRPGAGALREREVSLEIGGVPVSATRFEPARGGPWRGWVVLHGITVPGRRHPVLLKFARSLAASGGVVVIPEVAEWTRLEVDPAVADRVIAGTARYLAADAAVREGRVGVVGFSFGATQALVSAASPEVRALLDRVVGFGGYCDLQATVRFMMLGEHEWEGRRYRLEPDPYGRWILAANYLRLVPGHEEHREVAEAARAMAAEAGRRGAYAGDPEYDPMKARLREELPEAQRAVWDLIAPPTGERPAREPALQLAHRLAEAAVRHHPRLDPRPVLDDLRGRIVLAHGHSDHLVPFSETLRLRDRIGAQAQVSATITRLFAHSAGAEALALHRYPLEAARYLGLLAAALRP